MTEDARKLRPQETVLVVEDEVFIRMVISDYLRGCGYEVIEAVNADEALVVLRHKETQVDVVFSDVEMPGSMDGFGLSRWIHTNRPDLVVILAGTIGGAAKSAEKLCEATHLPKPYEVQLVVDRIKRLIASRASRKDT